MSEDIPSGWSNPGHESPTVYYQVKYFVKNHPTTLFNNVRNYQAALDFVGYMRDHEPSLVWIEVWQISCKKEIWP